MEFLMKQNFNEKLYSKKIKKHRHLKKDVSEKINLK